MSNITSFLASSIIFEDDMQILENSALSVSDGRITSIGDPHPDAEIIDLGHVLLSPMFVDAHCHLGDTGAKEIGIGLPLEQVVVPPDGLKHRFLANIDHQTHIQQMHHGMVEMLRNGIIACADFREQGLDGVRAIQQASEKLPIRLVTLGRMSEGNSGEELHEEAISILENADGLGIRDINAYPIDLINELRNQFPDKIFAMHVSEGATSEKRSHKEFGAGQTARALEISLDLLIHLTNTPALDLYKVATCGTKAVCCPRANAILGDGLPDLAAWIAAGIEFGIGSDNMMVSSPDMFREMDFLSRMARGAHQDPSAIDFRQVFKAATINGAKALKIEQDLGSLAIGKEASFLVIDLDSPNLTFIKDVVSAMVHRAGTTDIRNIYIKGEKYL